MSKDLRRVVVIGTSCCGKTTLARQLSKRLGSPHIELDALHWLPNWIERPDEAFCSLVRGATTADRWVVDGNYSQAADITWTRATAIIWLNYSFPTAFRRALRRTLWRAITQEELFSGNRESLRTALFSKDSILWWVITTHHARRKRYRQLRESEAYPHLEWIEFRKPREAEHFLASL